jgi:alanyl-tRNA synthetase
MTERLYYVEPARLEFDGRVLSSTPHESAWRVVLDRTAFYPTSGGQPHDTGTLAEAKVSDVIELDSGEIAHVTDRSFREGDRVHGVVDAGRRVDHVQQHSGQHVLSAAFVATSGVATMSFHLGADSSTIDLEREVTPREIAAAEARANEVVWENRPVTIRFVSAAEADQLPLRKEPSRSGTLRLIDIEGVDLSACGGTHVARTGDIGAIAVRRWERFKGATRVEFLCGRRALGSYRALRDEIEATIRLLSVAPDEVAQAVERLQETLRTQRRTLRTLGEKLAAHEAVAMAARATDVAGVALVAEVVEGLEAGDLKAMAASLLAEPRRAVVLVSSAEGRPALVGRSADVALDAAAVIRALVARFGGRGGGRPEQAQGGGFTGGAAPVLAAAREAVATALGQ